MFTLKWLRQEQAPRKKQCSVPTTSVLQSNSVVFLSSSSNNCFVMLYRTSNTSLKYTKVIYNITFSVNPICMFVFNMTDFNTKINRSHYKKVNVITVYMLLHIDTVCLSVKQYTVCLSYHIHHFNYPSSLGLSNVSMVLTHTIVEFVYFNQPTQIFCLQILHFNTN